MKEIKSSNLNLILFILFIIYWVMVYGVSFFVSQKDKKKFKQFFPTGYYMFAPMTRTGNDVLYKFYNKGVPVTEVVLSEYIKEEYKKPIYTNKISWAKERMFQGKLKVLDYRYQLALYNEINNLPDASFESAVKEDEELKNIDRSLRSFSGLYLKENPEFSVDSVSIIVGRSPFILAFAPEYRGDFTYTAGEGVFYTTYQKFE